jgi:prophage regulatory protein
MTQAIQTPVHILSRREVTAKTRLPCSSIYERTNPKNQNYDPTFPKQIRLGARAVGWLEREVEEWLASKIQESRKQPAPTKSRKA